MRASALAPATLIFLIEILTVPIEGFFVVVVVVAAVVVFKPVVPWLLHCPMQSGVCAAFEPGPGEVTVGIL